MDGLGVKPKQKRRRHKTMLGLDPKMLAQAQEVGQHVKCLAVVDYADNSINLTFTSDVPAGQAFIPEMIEQFTTALGTQLHQFFGISGHMNEKNKPDKLAP